MKEAYESKKYAFVSDVARLLIIYQFGGVYLDTDVELFASLEELMGNDAFFAFESNRNVNSGLGFGAIKGHNLIKNMLDPYEKKHFLVNGKKCLMPCPAINTEVLENYYQDFRRNGKSQKFEDIHILSFEEYSCYAKHYGAATWVEGPKPIKKKYHDTRAKRFLRNPRCFLYIERFFGKKAVQLYTFFVYDLLELGIIYYVKRIIVKLKGKE